MELNTDVVIIGSGVGGLFSALSLSADKKIVMITKSDLESSDRFLAQGGICVMRGLDDYDSYFEDTLKAGHYENRKEAVDIMIRGSQEIIKDLVGYGVEFEKRTENSLTPEKAPTQGRAYCFMKISQARRLQANCLRK